MLASRNQVLYETIQKELNSQRNWKEEHSGLMKSVIEKQEKRRSKIRVDMKQVEEKKENMKQSIRTSEDRLYLFQGISKDGQGRKAYLHARNKLKPQKRALKPLTTSQEIGWEAGLKENKKLCSAPLYGKKGKLKHDFYSTSGIF